MVTGALASGRVGHAYLFSGPRGCGKTTVARLFAKALNCENPQGVEPCGRCEHCRALVEGRSLDVIEIDGASNNSVDEVRELKANVGLSSFGGRWKVYIIDEVHMLSQAAFNALLKTLEEPPSGVLFLLATTEPFKVPATIRSRCQHLPFQGIPPRLIVDQLAVVAEAEGVTVDSESLWELARLSDGGMRDALSLLEQALALGQGQLDGALVDRLIGGSGRSLRRWLDELWSGQPEAPLTMDRFLRDGAVPERLVNGLFELIRNLWLAARGGEKALEGLQTAPEERAWLASRSRVTDRRSAEVLMTRLASLHAQLRRGLSSGALSGLLSSWCASLASGGQDRPRDERISQPSPPQRELSVRQSAPFDRKSERGSELGEVFKAQDADCKLQDVPCSSATPLSAEPAVPREGALPLGRLTDALQEYDPFFIAACMLGRVTVDCGVWRLDLPETEGLAFALACTGRRMEQLALQLAEWGLDPACLVISCGDRQVSAGGYAPPEPLQVPPPAQKGVKKNESGAHNAAPDPVMPPRLSADEKVESAIPDPAVSAAVDSPETGDRAVETALSPQKEGPARAHKDRRRAQSSQQALETLILNPLLRELVAEARQATECQLIFTRQGTDAEEDNGAGEERE